MNRCAEQPRIVTTGHEAFSMNSEPSTPKSWNKDDLRKLGGVDKDFRILVYKRTHHGDPDPRDGIFGNHDCMKSVRGFAFDAVIGVGGVGPEARSNDIEPRVMWIGIGRHDDWTIPTPSGAPRLWFDHFKMYDANTGDELKVIAKKLDKRLYQGGSRYLLNLSEDELCEALKILAQALGSPASTGRPGRSAVATPSSATSSSCSRNQPTAVIANPPCRP